jgi:hypothetical protein
MIEEISLMIKSIIVEYISNIYQGRYLSSFCFRIFRDIFRTVDIAAVMWIMGVLVFCEEVVLSESGCREASVF